MRRKRYKSVNSKVFDIAGNSQHVMDKFIRILFSGICFLELYSRSPRQVANRMWNTQSLHKQYLLLIYESRRDASLSAYCSIPEPNSGTVSRNRNTLTTKLPDCIKKNNVYKRNLYSFVWYNLIDIEGKNWCVVILNGLSTLSMCSNYCIY